MASRKYPLFVFDVAAALKKRYRDFNHYNLTGMANAPTLMKKLAVPVSPYPTFPRKREKGQTNRFANFALIDPLDELLFIICSTKTGEASYRSTFRSLKETFPIHLRIAEAPAR